MLEIMICHQEQIQEWKLFLLVMQLVMEIYTCLVIYLQEEDLNNKDSKKINMYPHG